MTSAPQCGCLEIPLRWSFARERFLSSPHTTECPCAGSQNTQWTWRFGWIKAASLHLIQVKVAPFVSHAPAVHWWNLSLCFSPTARSDYLASRKSCQWSSIEQIYTQLSQIYFCLFVVLNETGAPEEKDVQIPMCDDFFLSSQQINVASWTLM